MVKIHSKMHLSGKGVSVDCFIDKEEIKLLSVLHAQSLAH